MWSVKCFWTFGFIYCKYLCIHVLMHCLSCMLYVLSYTWPRCRRQFPTLTKEFFDEGSRNLFLTVFQWPTVLQLCRDSLRGGQTGHVKGKLYVGSWQFHKMYDQRLGVYLYTAIKPVWPWNIQIYSRRS